MSITVNILRAKRMLIKAMQAGLVPMMHGSPAIGKSAIVKQIAKEFNLMLIDLRLGQCDPTDLLGFPYNDEKTGKSGYRPMETFPIEGDKLPVNPETGEPYAGWLLFLDELTSADDSVQKAAYKLILDRMVGVKNLHPLCAMMAAGNLATDGAIVYEMSTALQSRMTHMEVTLDFKTWMAWAVSFGIDHRIRDYLNYQNESLYTFKPDHTDRTYGAPRTWEFADRLLKTIGLEDEDFTPLCSGTISPGLTSQFMMFCLVYKDLPTIDQIEALPEAAPVPSQLSSVFAMCGTLSNALTVKNAPQLMKYIKRLSSEFQVVVLRDAVHRDKNLIQDAQIRKWATDNASELF